MATFRDYTNKFRFAIAKKQVMNDIFNDSRYFKKEDIRKEDIWKSYTNREEVDRDLMKKYFKFDQNQMNILLDEAKKQELNAQVKETLEEMGETDDKKADEITQEMQEEERKNPQNEEQHKDRKAQLKGKIIEAAVYNRARSYQRDVIAQKEEQVAMKNMGLSEADALKDMREEQLYLRMSEKYKKYTGKNITDNKKIKDMQKEFTKKDEALSKAAEKREQNSMDNAYDLRRYKAEKFEEYIKAIERNDPKLDLYKKEYEDACYNIVVNEEKGKDTKYDEQLKTQQKIEAKAKEKGVSKISAVNRTINYNGKREDKITDSKLVERFEEGRDDNRRENEIIQDKIDAKSRELTREGKYNELQNLQAENEKNARIETNIDSGKVEGVQYKDTYSDTRATINKSDRELKETKQENFDDFRKDLKSNVVSIDENAEHVAKENEKSREEYQKEMKKDAMKDEQDANLVIRRNNKKYGNPNGK